MKASRCSDALKAFVLRQGADGISVVDNCRKVRIAQATDFNRKRCNALLPTEMRRLDRFEDENMRRPKVVSDLSVDKERWRDAGRRKLWSLSGGDDWSVGGRAGRECVLAMVDMFSRFSPAPEPRLTFRGTGVLEVLEKASRELGVPATIRVDQGQSSCHASGGLWVCHRDERLAGLGVVPALLEEFNEERVDDPDGSTMKIRGLGRCPTVTAVHKECWHNPSGALRVAS